MQIRVQPPFQALSPPPSRWGSPPPPPRPAASSCGRLAGSPLYRLREGSWPSPRPARRTPTWATRDSGRSAGARRTPRGPDLKSSGRREEVVGKERREGPLAGGPGSGRGVRSRNPHSENSFAVAGPRFRLARTNESGLATGRRCIPKRTPVRGRTTRGRLRPRKSGRAPGRWRADPSGAVAAPGTRGAVFILAPVKPFQFRAPGPSETRIGERLSEVPIWGPP